MKIFIVTCPQLANKRLSPIIEKIIPLVSEGLISSIEIISESDDSLSKKLGDIYNRSKWNEDIKKGWGMFYRNLAWSLDSRGNRLPDDAIIDPCKVFPGRELTISEHSIALRHIKAIKEISKEPDTCMVLEDDAMIKSYENISKLVKMVLQGYEKVTFFDLCDNFIPIPKSNNLFRKSIDGLDIVKHPIAITRTLMAYAINAKTANIIYNGIKHYSLPIDMQLQAIISEKQIPGFSVTSPLFIHGSKSGEFDSAIDQT